MAAGGVEMAAAIEELCRHLVAGARLGQTPSIDDTRLDKGRLDLIFKTTDVPTLYTGLFELATFDGISIKNIIFFDN